MPRAITEDFLMTCRFHLLDVSMSIPPVITPVAGFSSITAPEINVEYKEIQEGTFEFPRKVFKSASVNNVVLTKGAKLQDSDFWYWMDNYSQGKREKKNLLLMQLTSVSAAQSTAAPASSGIGKALGGLTALPSAILAGLRTPGRAWVLRNCSPARYKVATDFDAGSSAISIMELEISYEFFVEFNMGGAK